MKIIFHVVLPVFILLTCKPVYAQIDVKNTGIVYISSAADTFFIAGAFINTSGAAFTNNGIVHVKKSITNDQPGMVAGLGTLLLNGNSTQVLSGIQTFKTHNLISNNTSGITLNNNLSVSGIHTFLAGMITTSSTPNYMIYEAGASYTGDGDNKHVNGWVKKIGSTNFVFPVGNAGYERTIALTSLTVASEFDVKYNRVLTPNHTSLFDPLVYVDTSEYWTINKISGSAAKVAMNWDNSKIKFPLLMIADVRAAYFDGTFWKSIGGSAIGNVTTMGSVASVSVSSFNTNFVIGSTSFVLPLRITSFGASRMEGYIRVNWSTQNEINVNSFELQRSEDGINFYSILKQSYGTISTHYSIYDDKSAGPGITYYRIRYTERNSVAKYSTIAAASAVKSDNRLLYVIKNPVNTGIDVYVTAAGKGTYKFALTNTSGQLVLSGTLEITQEGIQTIPLPEVLPKGMYVLLVFNRDFQLQKNILKE